MGQVCLISGPPGCGKTTWALQRLQQHQGPCAYLRLEGEKAAGLEQGEDSGIDLTWLKDQVPRLEGTGNNRHDKSESAQRWADPDRSAAVPSTQPGGH